MMGSEGNPWGVARGNPSSRKDEALHTCGWAQWGHQVDASARGLRTLLASKPRANMISCAPHGCPQGPVRCIKGAGGESLWEPHTPPAGAAGEVKKPAGERALPRELREG